MIIVKCSSCGHANQVSDQSAGRKGKCSRCRTPYDVPLDAKPRAVKNRSPISYQIKTPSSPVQSVLDLFNITPVGWEILKPILILLLLLPGYWLLNGLLSEITIFSSAMYLYGGAILIQLVVFWAAWNNTPKWFWYSSVVMSLVLLIWIGATDRYGIADYSEPGVTRAYVYSRWESAPYLMLEILPQGESLYNFYLGPINSAGEKHGEWKRWNRHDLFFNMDTYGMDVKTHPLWFWEDNQVSLSEWQRLTESL